MKRQFEFLNKDFELLKEKCFILSEINNVICTNKLKKFSEIKKKIDTSISYVCDNIDENVFKQPIERTSSLSPDITTPLLDSLMKQKRRKEYREKTQLIQFNIKKVFSP